MQASLSEHYNKELVEKSLWIALSSIHGVGTQTFFLLLNTFGNPANIFAASFKQLNEIVSEKIAAEITQGVNHDALADSLQWLSQANNHLVTLADSDYPKALLEISDPHRLCYTPKVT